METLSYRCRPPLGPLGAEGCWPSKPRSPNSPPAFSSTCRTRRLYQPASARRLERRPRTAGADHVPRTRSAASGSAGPAKRGAALSRKLLAAVLTLVLAGWLLQGCGPSGGEMTPATASTLQPSSHTPAPKRDYGVSVDPQPQWGGLRGADFCRSLSHDRLLPFNAAIMRQHNPLARHGHCPARNARWPSGRRV